MNYYHQSRGTPAQYRSRSFPVHHEHSTSFGPSVFPTETQSSMAFTQPGSRRERQALLEDIQAILNTSYHSLPSGLARQAEHVLQTARQQRNENDESYVKFLLGQLRNTLADRSKQQLQQYVAPNRQNSNETQIFQDTTHVPHATRIHSQEIWDRRPQQQQQFSSFSSQRRSQPLIQDDDDSEDYRDYQSQQQTQQSRAPQSLFGRSAAATAANPQHHLAAFGGISRTLLPNSQQPPHNLSRNLIANRMHVDMQGPRSNEANTPRTLFNRDAFYDPGDVQRSGFSNFDESRTMQFDRKDPFAERYGYYPGVVEARRGGGALRTKRGGGAIVDRRGGGALNARRGGGALNARRGGGALNARRGGGALNARRGGGALNARRGGGALNARRGGGALNARRGGGALNARRGGGAAPSASPSRPVIKSLFPSHQQSRMESQSNQSSINNSKKRKKQAKTENRKKREKNKMKKLNREIKIPHLTNFLSNKQIKKLKHNGMFENVYNGIWTALCPPDGKKHENVDLNALLTIFVRSYECVECNQKFKSFHLLAEHVGPKRLKSKLLPHRLTPVQASMLEILSELRPETLKYLQFHHKGHRAKFLNAGRDLPPLPLESGVASLIPWKRDLDAPAIFGSKGFGPKGRMFCVCCKLSVPSAKFKEHQRLNECLEPIRCDDCGLEFGGFWRYKFHRWAKRNRQNSAPSNRCPMGCEGEFAKGPSGDKNWRIHIYQMHPITEFDGAVILNGEFSPESQFFCFFCDFKSKSVDFILDHIEKFHKVAARPPLACQICLKIHSNVDELFNHLKSEHDEKQLKSAEELADIIRNEFEVVIESGTANVSNGSTMVNVPNESTMVNVSNGSTMLNGAMESTTASVPMESPIVNVPTFDCWQCGENFQNWNEVLKCRIKHRRINSYRCMECDEIVEGTADDWRRHWVQGCSKGLEREVRQMMNVILGRIG